MSMITYFVIGLSLPQMAPISLAYQEHKGDLYLSPNVRLSGLDRMACIESEALAQEFLEACMPILQKRYGNETAGYVVKHSSSDKKLIGTIQEHSGIIRKRLLAKNFSPNKAVL